MKRAQAARLGRPFGPQLGMKGHNIKAFTPPWASTDTRTAPSYLDAGEELSTRASCRAAPSGSVLERFWSHVRILQGGESGSGLLWLPWEPRGIWRGCSPFLQAGVSRGVLHGDGQDGGDDAAADEGV